MVAGQRAFVGDDATIRIAATLPSSVDRALAWRSGSIDLVGETLQDAVDDFNRYNRRKLVLLEPKLSREQFDGTFRTDDPEGFAAAVSHSFGVAINLQDPDTIRIGTSS